MDEAIASGGVVDGVIGSVDPLDDDDENTRGEDEFGELGNSTVVFRGRVPKIRKDGFICAVTTQRLRTFPNIRFLPLETTTSSTPSTTTKRLKKFLVKHIRRPC
ncbi:hypothetical protein DSL72_008394 [Monilinia vaccinii-corymbosi]|uniref:Uncharacterized protein n=1 Tax=Monilinia vaccinii-corymbosi TaxID=61207 RepID=A0A8A3PKN5_9HELO|nr:hypothetical protein DSL72_008394 [Monilinia vaccinii-corymbosi]